MKIYKISLKSLSSLASPLHSDTIFGAFCWAYRYIYGNQELENLLGKFLINGPKVIFSNGFKDDFLPMPINANKELVNTLFEGNKQERFKNSKKRKKIKKIKYLNLEQFNKIINNQNFKFTNSYKESIKITRFSNMVNRFYGTVMTDEDGNGALYSRVEEYSMNNYSVYMKIEEGFEDIVHKTLTYAFSFGIGADKSVGKGLFEVVGFEEFNDFQIPTNPNGFIVMSNYIPDKKDPIDGYYRIITKYGKLDREFSTTEKPFKKPLIVITEGAVFKDTTVKEYYGRFVRNVSNLSDKIIHNGIAFTLPILIT